MTFNEFRFLFDKHIHAKLNNYLTKLSANFSQAICLKLNIQLKGIQGQIQLSVFLKTERPIALPDTRNLLSVLCICTVKRIARIKGSKMHTLNLVFSYKTENIVN